MSGRKENAVRVAALYDIHGNLPALEAVLAEVRTAGVEQIVVGGDVVPGPLATETMRRLQEIDLPVEYIRGNCEVAALEAMAGNAPAGVPEQQRPIFAWTAKRMAAFERDFAAWPKTLRKEIAGVGKVLFCHGTPRDENEIFTKVTAEERLLPIFAGVDADVAVCGHTHMQFDRRIGSTRVVNAGSVGMPFGQPGADWLLLGPGVELKHTSYDLAEAADRIRGSDYPDAESFIARYLLKPPAESEMLAAFAKVEVGSRQ
jgi:putative phosphoesterase